MRGKMTSDISTTPALASASLDLSTAVSGLSQGASSGGTRGTVTDPTAARRCWGDRDAPKYGYDSLQEVDNLFGGALRPCPNGQTNPTRVR